MKIETNVHPILRGAPPNDSFRGNDREWFVKEHLAESALNRCFGDKVGATFLLVEALQAVREFDWKPWSPPVEEETPF